MAARFDIPLANHRGILGAFLAAHAIPDAIDLMFTGVGCKPKTQRQIALHDRAREAGNKMIWADVSDVHLITGPTERLRSMAVESYRRRGGVGLIVVTTSAAMEMTGADVEAALPAIRAEVGCPVVYLPTAGWGGDRFSGYAGVVKAVMALAPWRAAKGDPRTICVSGYLLDRYEHDHAANLRELSRLIGGVGGTRGEVFLAGAPMAALMTAPRAGAHLVLPYAGDVASWAPSATGRPAVAVDLPIGTAASARFVVEAARLIGAPERAARAFAEGERARMQKALAGARGRLQGLHAAVLADTPLAAGVCGLLRDLGVTPILAGLLDRTLGGAAAFSAAVDLDGHDAAGCLVLEDPSTGDLEDARRALCRRARARRGRLFDLVIAPDLWLPPWMTDGAARVELGFPSNRWHPAEPSPFLGFAGALALTRRLLEATTAAR